MFLTLDEVKVGKRIATAMGLTARAEEIFKLAGIEATDGLVIVCEPGGHHFYIIDEDDEDDEGPYTIGLRPIEGEGFIRNGEIFVY